MDKDSEVTKIARVQGAMVRVDPPVEEDINPVDMDLDDEVDVGKQLEEISLKKMNV